MVLGVCRRVLRDESDVEDAFQATFVVLARKAGSINQGSRLGNWLYGVAHRIALKARTRNRTRRRKETEAARRPTPQGPTDAIERLLPLLDAELSRLPERFRVAIVLCELQGSSIKDAAQRLGWRQGTLASRLSRGRRLLARRLARRSGEAAWVGVAAILVQAAQAAHAPLPARLATLSAELTYGIQRSAPAGVVSHRAVSLARGVMRSMLLKKLTLTTCILPIVAAATLSLAAAAGAICHSQPGEVGLAMQLGAPAESRPATQDRPKPKPGDAKATARALEQLKGTWKVVRAVRDGEEAPEGNKGDKVIFDGKEITVEHRGAVGEKALVEIDLSCDPVGFDVTALDRDGNQLATLPGIVRIEKHRVTICQARAKAARPKEFASTKDNECMLLVLERDQP
jgi:RNA polymerase sigma-70 factor (ECF subfamily)